jgi:hypothetical protein
MSSDWTGSIEIRRGTARHQADTQRWAGNDYGVSLLLIVGTGLAIGEMSQSHRLRISSSHKKEAS